MVVQRRARGGPIALGGLRKRKAEGNLAVVRIERERIGKCLPRRGKTAVGEIRLAEHRAIASLARRKRDRLFGIIDGIVGMALRSEEHTSELQSLMRTSYAVFSLKKKTKIQKTGTLTHTTLTH